MRVVLISLYDEWCLGLRSLSAVLKRDGHDARLAWVHSLRQINAGPDVAGPDGYFVPPASVPRRDLEALAQLVRELQPGLIGIGHSSNFSGLAERVTRELRAVWPVPIVWGGVDTTANPDWAIQHADIICRGEGEGAMTELARRLEHGADPADIPNLWVRRPDGQVARNPLRPLIEDLDALPWADFDPAGKYWISDGRAQPGVIPKGSNLEHSFPTMASRGCLYACAYCCNSMYRELYGSKGYVRLRSPEHVVGEIEAYVTAHPAIDTVEFLDDVFGFKREWVERFSQLYRARVQLPFWFFTYPSVCRPEILEPLKRAGAWFVVMGLQSGSQRTLNEDYCRRAPRERTLQAARAIRDCGLPMIVDLIIGDPLETDADYRETLDLLLDFPRPFILHEVNHLGLYRNYPLTTRLMQAGLLPDFMPGRNATMTPLTADMRLWRALFTMAQFEQVEPATLRAMAGDPFLRERPEVAEDLAAAMVDMTYIPGSRIPRQWAVQRQVDDLRGRLSRYEDSRMVQAYFRAKRMLRRARPDHFLSARSSPSSTR